jgi:hypothetical protein
MNSEYEKLLEAEITRALKALPPLDAPESLAGRVMNTLARRANAPWYQSSWQSWPAALQWGSLLVLSIIFGAVCFSGWILSQTHTVALAASRVGDWTAVLAALHHTLSVLTGSVFVVLNRLGPGFVIACLGAVILGYTLCLALGTLYLRVALAASEPFKKST